MHLCLIPQRQHNLIPRREIFVCTRIGLEPIRVVTTNSRAQHAPLTYSEPPVVYPASFRWQSSSLVGLQPTIAGQATPHPTRGPIASPVTETLKIIRRFCFHLLDRNLQRVFQVPLRISRPWSNFDYLIYLNSIRFELMASGVPP